MIKDTMQMKCNDYWKEDIISGRGDKRRAAAWSRLHYPYAPIGFVGTRAYMDIYGEVLTYSEMYAMLTKERKNEHDRGLKKRIKEFVKK